MTYVYFFSVVFSFRHQLCKESGSGKSSHRSKDKNSKIYKGSSSSRRKKHRDGSSKMMGIPMTDFNEEDPYFSDAGHVYI